MQILLLLIVLFVIAVYICSLLPHGSYAKDKLIENIDELLPQTQCGACSYSGCLPYAQAIVEGSADINQCSPGGDVTINAIANLTGQVPKALNPEHALVKSDQVALIDEELCIGCVKCIHVCPVDAIIGAPKQMHTIITEACTGCELCIPPCPVDCISLEASYDNHSRWKWVKPGQAVIVKR